MKIFSKINVNEEEYEVSGYIDGDRCIEDIDIADLPDDLYNEETIAMAEEALSFDSPV